MVKFRFSHVRHIAVLIESSRAYGRGLIEGVARYSKEHGNWSLYFEPRGLEAPPLWWSTWQGDGILARFPNRQMGKEVLAKNLPVVDLYGGLTDSCLPQLAGNNAGIARMAFEHFWERGIRSFAFCDLPATTEPYLEQRKNAFRRLAEATDCPCQVFPSRSNRRTMADWKQEQSKLAVWLKGLLKPVGVLACSDEHGYRVLSGCGQAHLRVPDEVAVVGIGNDPVLCEMCTPTLSSIDLDAPQIGYEAATLLDRLMQGYKLPTDPLRIEPLRLVARGSTVLAIGDPEVRAALEFIREHGCDGIRVSDVVREVGMSISTLERKFKSFLGSTPKGELFRIQIERAKQLLAESGLTLKELAQRCGFSSDKYFSDAFYRQLGIRPGTYRKEHGGGRFGLLAKSETIG